MSDKATKQSNTNFRCETCDYSCSNKSNYEKHLLTAKHIRLTTTDIKMGEYACVCGKKYKQRQSLHKHKKTCKGRQEPPEDHSVIPQEDPITKLQGEIRELREQILQHQQFMEKQSENLNKLMMEFLSKVQFHPGREAPL